MCLFFYCSVAENVQLEMLDGKLVGCIVSRVMGKIWKGPSAKRQNDQQGIVYIIT